MLILSLLQDPLSFVGFILALLLAITVHEASHAFTAWKFGDDTAKINGRVSLNPIVHLDPIGTIVLFLVGFGWGKPVPINPNNFKNPRKDEILVSLAGPFSNLIIAVVFSLILRLLPIDSAIGSIFSIIIYINLALMIFNLLPIPPLDGSHFLKIFFKEETYLYFQQYGFIFVILFTYFILFRYPILPIILEYIYRFLTGNYFNF